MSGMMLLLMSNTKPKQGVVFREFRAQVMVIEPDYNDAGYQTRIYVRPPDFPVGFEAPVPTDKPTISPRRTMLPVPQTDSVASQECVGEQAEGEQTAGDEVVTEDELARGVGAECVDERAPLHYVQGRRWSPGVYRSLRLLGKPLQVAWRRVFIALPTF
jgi:hypothetical protein